ncbi:MAG: pantoate--beta-alanine ligase [Candidatus Eisenbacteria bacterium]|nr:pantoate--beta-alanine ligase [Candidatus Eisenbacteria bacterium]
MKVIGRAAEMRDFSDSERRKKKKIAFVPTMGYLHEGHLSLLRKARKIADTTVMSIFVNPLQFGPAEDFKHYPRAPKKDLMLAKNEGCSVVFIPGINEMYPAGEKTRVEVLGLSGILCGKFRPGHFVGVTTVVAKLLNAVNPHFLVLGRKDAQQAAIIERMVKDLHFPVKVVVCPTVREKGGLAASSRNKYLSDSERQDALVLFRALSLGRRLIQQGEKRARVVRENMRKLIKRFPSVKLEYVSVVDPRSLEEIKTVKGNVILALAARLGKTRLIDNVLAGGRR